MAKLGGNLRCVVVETARETVRALFRETFGADLSHPTQTMDVFSFGGSNIGVEFVAAGKALSEEQQREMGVWIEIVVDDVAATEGELEARGMKRLDDQDKSHSYFQVPSGPVFRLAALASS